ncbi:nitrous oxide reductase accessory protein NosL [Xanthovirga aplysinae]|uniref:nitrous oxide reductase accessory protein NosL n=1 Tax=Xanthovirga aplysinae TaxID=2529853 RepID=UPI0012BD328B|nr:nitrous oxide reductase accessory protein NosL [Xanthovirga aplysinae]MTI33489.1 hypothetical protein [Xanthovirga aplysinae]
MSKNLSKHIGLLILLIYFTCSCRIKPKAIKYGKDSCFYCQMIINDQRYGAELVTARGKVYKFDATECLINTLKNGTLRNKTPRYILVNTYDAPTEFTEVGQAYFLRTIKLPSPMGMYITAFSEKEIAQQNQAEKGGSLFHWEELYDQFNTLPPLSPLIHE